MFLMSSPDEQTLISISVADILRMVEERDSLNARAAALTEEITTIRKLVGADRFDAMVGKPVVMVTPALKRPNTLRSALLEILKSHPGGLTYNDLRPLLVNELEGYSPNTLLNTVGLMAQRGEIGKIGHRLFPRAAYDALSPEEKAALEEAGRPPVRKFILALLKQERKGMTAGELKDRYETIHGALSPNGIYAALSRASQDGEVKRDAENGRYVLVSRPNEP